MSPPYDLNFALALVPAFLMLVAALCGRSRRASVRHLWRQFIGLSIAALVFSLLALITQMSLVPANASMRAQSDGWLAANLFGAWVSVLVQFLGVAIGIFSSRHLEGEPRQAVYIAALAAVLSSVHFLLLANHWAVLIAAWAAIEWAMHYLLCFYKDRPFALLAAHKKMVTDRAADGLLIAAAVLSWAEVGSGSFSALWAHIEAGHASAALAWSGICLALAVIARTALMPVHGWLVQVMEAPTPVSALLHAGVVNLGGYVLVLFAPLLGVSLVARWLLVIFGLVSAVVAGLVLLTRVSQKVHLAWSTIAQMGFMVLECGLGLYLFAALHLLGHSLYKAHNFLNASSAVEESNRKLVTGASENSSFSMIIAVPVALIVVFSLQSLTNSHAWPWWWSAVLALAWAPLLWVPKATPGRAGVVAVRVATALAAAAFLTLVTGVMDHVPVGADNDPLDAAGLVALIGMGAMYLEMAAFQLWPRSVVVARRWVYAGFYMDEGYTHWVLILWPARWAGADSKAAPAPWVLSEPVSGPSKS